MLDFNETIWNMESQEFQNPGFSAKTPAFSMGPTFLKVLDFQGIYIYTYIGIMVYPD